MAGMPESAKGIINWVLVVGIIAFILLLFGIIFGNLSGSVGFATGSQGYNDTQAIILNYTQSGVNTAAQLPTVGTIIGIVLLIIILLSVLVFVILRLMGITEKTGGGSNAAFG